MKRGALIAAAGMLLVSGQANAIDVSEGTVLAFDRKAKVLVFTDKSVWPLSKLSSSLPSDMKAGDRVEIEYDMNEDEGITEIYSIRIIPQ